MLSILDALAPDRLPAPSPEQLRRWAGLARLGDGGVTMDGQVRFLLEILEGDAASAGVLRGS